MNNFKPYTEQYTTREIADMDAGGVLPTNPTLVPYLAGLLEPHDHDVEPRIYDPMAGTGEFIHLLSEALNAKAYGNERLTYPAEEMIERLGSRYAFREHYEDRTMSVTRVSMSWIHIHQGGHVLNNSRQIEDAVKDLNRRLMYPGYMTIVMSETQFDRDLAMTLAMRSEYLDVYYTGDNMPPRYRTHHGGPAKQIIVVSRQNQDRPKYIQDVPDGPYKAAFESWFYRELNPRRLRMETRVQDESNRPDIYIPGRDIYVPDPYWEPQEIEYPVAYMTKYKDPSQEKLGWAYRADFLVALVNTGQLLTVQEAYEMGVKYPALEVAKTQSGRVTFIPRRLPDHVIMQDAQKSGPHLAASLDTHISVPVNTEPFAPVMSVRPRQLSSIVSSGAMGAVVKAYDDNAGHRVAIRASVYYHQRTTDTKHIHSEVDGQLDRIVQTKKMLPKIRIMVLHETGVIENLDEDERLADYMMRVGPNLMEMARDDFPPIYDMEDDPIVPYLADAINSVRVKGRYPLKDTQKHVVAATVKKLGKDGKAILVGDVGVGKTAMTIAMAHVMRQRAYELRFSKRKMRQENGVIKPGEIITALVPPIVSDNKWVAEFRENIPNVNVKLCESYADVDGILADAEQTREAAERCKAAWHAGIDPHDEDVALATRLNVAVFAESKAKVQDGNTWVYTHGTDMARALKPMAGTNRTWFDGLLDPATGRALTKSKASVDKPLTLSDLTTTKKGTIKSSTKLPWSGIADHTRRRNKPKPRYDAAQGHEIIGDAISKQQIQAAEFDERMADDDFRLGVEAGHIDPYGYTHVPKAFGFNRYENGQYVRDANGSVVVREIGSYWTYVRQAMDKVRKERAQKEGVVSTPLWQAARITGDYQQVDRAALADALGSRARRVMPLPDILERAALTANFRYDILDERSEHNPGRPVNLVEYLLKNLGRGNRVDIGFTIIDEVHEFNKMSIRGQQMTQLANRARMTLGATGTLYGGKASSLYLLLFIFSEEVRRRYPDPTSNLTYDNWVKDHGVYSWEETNQIRNAKGDPERRTLEGRIKEDAGGGPSLLRLLLNEAVFVSMSDMGEDLPPMAKVPKPIEMDPHERDFYVAIENTLMGCLQRMRELSRQHNAPLMQGMASVMYRTLMQHANDPWREKQVIHKVKLSPEKYRQLALDGVIENPEPWVRTATQEEMDEMSDVTWENHIATIPAMDWNRVSSKERWILQMLRGEIAEGRGVTLTFRNTKAHDMTPRWTNAQGTGLIDLYVPEAKPHIMQSGDVPTKERAAFIRDLEADGYNVLLGNAKLFSTGIDMLFFGQTIVPVEIDWSLFTLQQLEGRGRRLSQENPCAVYYPYSVKTMDPDVAKQITPTMEERAIRIMAAKTEAADRLSGKGTGGLGAMAEGLTDSIEQAVVNELAGDDAGSVYNVGRENFVVDGLTWDPPMYDEGHEDLLETIHNDPAQLDVEDVLIEAPGLFDGDFLGEGEVPAETFVNFNTTVTLDTLFEQLGQGLRDIELEIDERVDLDDMLDEMDRRAGEYSGEAVGVQFWDEEDHRQGYVELGDPAQDALQQTEADLAWNQEGDVPEAAPPDDDFDSELEDAWGDVIDDVLASMDPEELEPAGEELPGETPTESDEDFGVRMARQDWDNEAFYPDFDNDAVYAAYIRAMAELTVQHDLETYGTADGQSLPEDVNEDLRRAYEAAAPTPSEDHTENHTEDVVESPAELLEEDITEDITEDVASIFTEEAEPLQDWDESYAAFLNTHSLRGRIQLMSHMLIKVDYGDGPVSRRVICERIVAEGHDVAEADEPIQQQGITYSHTANGWMLTEQQARYIVFLQS